MTSITDHEFLVTGFEAAEERHAAAEQAGRTASSQLATARVRVSEAQRALDLATDERERSISDWLEGLKGRNPLYAASFYLSPFNKRNIGDVRNAHERGNFLLTIGHILASGPQPTMVLDIKSRRGIADPESDYVGFDAIIGSTHNDAISHTATETVDPDTGTVTRILRAVTLNLRDAVRVTKDPRMSIDEVTIAQPGDMSMVLVGEEPGLAKTDYAALGIEELDGPMEIEWLGGAGDDAHHLYIGSGAVKLARAQLEEAARGKILGPEPVSVLDSEIQKVLA